MILGVGRRNLEEMEIRNDVSSVKEKYYESKKIEMTKSV